MISMSCCDDDKFDFFNKIFNEMNDIYITSQEIQAQRLKLTEMDKKYFETKTGSLEDVSTKIAIEQPTITKEEPKVKLTVDKTYFDVKPGSLADAAAKVVSEGKEIKEVSSRSK